MRPIIFCRICKERKRKHSKNLCFNCYRKYLWKPKKAERKRCKREMKIHSRGLCGGGYNFVFHLDRNKPIISRNGIT